MDKAQDVKKLQEDIVLIEQAIRCKENEIRSSKYIKVIDDIVNILAAEIKNTEICSAKTADLNGLAMTTAMIAEKAFYMTLKLKDGTR